MSEKVVKSIQMTTSLYIKASIIDDDDVLISIVECFRGRFIALAFSRSSSFSNFRLEDYARLSWKASGNAKNKENASVLLAVNSFLYFMDWGFTE